MTRRIYLIPALISAILVVPVGVRATATPTPEPSATATSTPEPTGSPNPTPVQLSSCSSGEMAYCPSVDVDDNGIVYMVWEEVAETAGGDVEHLVKLKYKKKTSAWEPVQVVSYLGASDWPSVDDEVAPRIRPNVRVDANVWPTPVTPLPTFSPLPTATSTPTVTPTPSVTVGPHHSPTSTKPPSPTPSPTPTNTPEGRVPLNRLEIAWLHFDETAGLAPAIVCATHYDVADEDYERLDFVTGRNATVGEPFMAPIPNTGFFLGHGARVFCTAKRNDVDTDRDVLQSGMYHDGNEYKNYPGTWFWGGMENTTRPDYVPPDYTPTPTPTGTILPKTRQDPTGAFEVDTSPYLMYEAFWVEDEGVYVYHRQPRADASPLPGATATPIGDYDEDKAGFGGTSEWKPLGESTPGAVYPLDGSNDSRLPYLAMKKVTSDDKKDIPHIAYIRTTLAEVDQLVHAEYNHSLELWQPSPQGGVDSGVSDIRPAMAINALGEIFIAYVKNGFLKVAICDASDEWTKHTLGFAYNDIQWIDLALDPSSPSTCHVVFSAKVSAQSAYQVYWDSKECE